MNLKTDADPTTNDDQPPSRDDEALEYLGLKMGDDDAPNADDDSDDKKDTTATADTSDDDAQPAGDDEAPDLAAQAAQPGAAGQGDGEQKAGDDELTPEFFALPEDAPERTRQRFEKLTGYYKEEHQKRLEHEQRAEQAEQQLHSVVGLISDAGASAEQFAGMLEFARLSNSGDPQQLQTARSMLQQQLSALNQSLGIQDEPANGSQQALSDDWAKHADLRDAVSNFDITEEHAAELARLRASQAPRPGTAGQQPAPQGNASLFSPMGQPAASQQRPMGVPQQPPQPQAPGLPVQVTARLNALGSTWKQTDVNYNAKMAKLTEHFPVIFQRTRPEAIAEAVEEYWNSLDGPAPTQRRNRPRPIGGAPASASGDVEPQNRDDAAIEYLKRAGLA
jgi:hypothetical protein